MSRRMSLFFGGAMLMGALIAPAQETQPAAPKKREPMKFTVEVEVPRLGVINQGQTGTCWCFGTTSFLESEITRLTKKEVDLSEMYTVVGGYVEKAKRNVAAGGKNTFGEGGLSHDVIELARIYGVCPESAYTGLPEGAKMHNHAEMSRVLEGMCKSMEKTKKTNPRFEKAVRAVVESYLGATPAKISVDGREMTPKEYADNYLKIPYDDYVEVMSFGYAPFWTDAELTVPDNWMHNAKYKNVPFDAMLDGLDYALRHGFSVAVDMDVSEKAFGVVARLSDDLEKPGAITQELRDKAFEAKETTDDHLMHVVGIAKNEKGEEYYITKNSWGKNGPYQGYFYMSKNYVAYKMLAFMVHKDGLPQALKEKAKM